MFRNGTLAILSLRREDAGGLWCGAVSEAGQTFPIRLFVKCLQTLFLKLIRLKKCILFI